MPLLPQDVPAVLLGLQGDTYGGQASDYDQRTGVFAYWRELLVETLPAHPGDTVLDVGCGTGLCFPLLLDKVGPGGTVVGIDPSPQMLDVARDRIVAEGWEGNVRLLAAPVVDAPLCHPADAAVFCAVHDVLQCPRSLNHVRDLLRPGAPVAAIGGKWPGAWLWQLRAWVTALHSPFVHDFTGFDRPWQLLADVVDDLQVHDLAFGAGYLALGHTPDAPGPTAAQDGGSTATQNGGPGAGGPGAGPGRTGRPAAGTPGTGS